MRFHLLWVFLCLLSSNQVHSATSDSTSVPFLLSVAYANDDFFAENQVNSFLRSELFPANDDFVTTSLFVNVKTQLLNRPFFSTLSYFIVTDRFLQYRSDLMVFSSGIDIQWFGLSGTLGAGFSINGDLGGTSVQNGYHRLFGYKNVELPYRIGYEYGGLAVVKLMKPLFKSSGSSVASHVQFQPVVGKAIPGHAEIGGSWIFQSAGFQWEMIMAYRYRIGIVPEFRRIFSSSFYAGGRASYELSSSLLASVWMTKNQYGVQNDLQFGLTFVYRLNDEPIPSLTELMTL